MQLVRPIECSVIDAIIAPYLPPTPNKLLRDNFVHNRDFVRRNWTVGRIVSEKWGGVSVYLTQVIQLVAQNIR